MAFTWPFSPLRFSAYARDLEIALLGISREYQMGLKLQGIASKVAKLHHDAEFEAAKLDAKVEEAAARLPAVFSGAHAALDGLAKDVGDIETVLSQVQSISNNGAPALDDDQKPVHQGLGATIIINPETSS